MKKLKLRNVFKRLLSLGTAFALMHAPVMAKTESNNETNTNESSFELVQQQKEIAPMTLVEYKLGIQEGVTYLAPFINYKTLQADFQCLYYLVTRAYMPKDVEDYLIENGIVFKTNFAEQQYETFMRAYNLLNVIADYNQSTIRNVGYLVDADMISYEAYDKELFNSYLTKAINNSNYTLGDAIVEYNNEVSEEHPELVINMPDTCYRHDDTMNPYLTKVLNGEYELKDAIKEYNSKAYEMLIDVSKLCYGDADIKLVHDMHVNYVNAYANGKYFNEDYQMVFKQLTTLNAQEKAGNADELSVGARWLAQNSIGGGVMQMLRDDMSQDFTRSELDKYFDRDELNKEQWILRSDVSFDYSNSCEEFGLEQEVNDFAQLWHFVYDTVNNDLMKTFEECKTK